MPKDRDWMDYANLASQVGQNIQLNQLKRGLDQTGEQLSEIARTARDSEQLERERLDREEDREWRAQEREWQEEERQEARLRLRDQIFQGVQWLKKIRAEPMPSDPRRALVVALISVHSPPTADLEDYQDKEHAQALQDDLAAFVHECEGRMDDAAQHTARTCLDYLCDQGTLTRLIRDTRKKELAAELQMVREVNLKDEIAKLEAELKNESANLQRLYQAVGRNFAFSCGASIAGILAAIIGISVGVAVGLIVFPAVIVAVPAALRYRKRLPEAQASAKKVARLAPRIEQMKKGLSARLRIDASLPNDVGEKFGDNLCSADYRKIFEERLPLIKQVLGITEHIPPDLDGVTVGGITIVETLALNEDKIREEEKLDDAPYDEPVGDESEKGDDEQLYQQAIEVLKATHRATPSMLQRRLLIGYDRAARIMELMEERCIVGPENGAQPRAILVDLDKL
jgi:hypothetical protein